LPKIEIEVDPEILEFLEWYAKMEKQSLQEFMLHDVLSGINSGIDIRRTKVFSFEKNAYVTIPEKFDKAIENIKDL